MIKTATLRLGQAVLFCTVLLALCGAATPQSGNPGATRDPKIMAESEYMSLTFPEQWSNGDMVFLPYQERTSYQQLSNIDFYILKGSAATADQGELLPWYIEVSMVVSEFEQANGYIPEQLTPELLQTIPDWEHKASANFDTLRNPVTGDWPYLNRDDFSPGDLYMRPLTRDEQVYLGAFDLCLHYNLLQRKQLDTEKYAQGLPIEDCFTIDIPADRVPFYIRVYGESGVLLTSFVGP